MCTATEAIYLADREQASRAAAQDAGECCARIAHEKLATAYAVRREGARAIGPAGHG
ncbi:MAG TPA: hypothetical protein VKQ27_16825 [Acetobacteraceae bacterium]|nr:hypothetical protein [Acetobacteraceae bacterium]